MTPGRAVPGIDILWIPLGAGAHAARIGGRVFEAVAAKAAGRPRCDLYHSALQVHTPEGVWVLEQTPVPPVGSANTRGVVAEGAFGVKGAGGFGSSGTRSGAGSAA